MQGELKMTKGLAIEKNYTKEEKLKAAYALNLCTVSVSQIVDYNDLYVLEQEYDAILNNLNLKEMPKDDALLKILSELLNTITFFRIQEIKKNQIESKYKRRIKNAIWSAVPSLSVVVSGNPVAIALSIATQIGTGYMNYRKEKVNAGYEKEDVEIELQITAIEQINALKRELFTTAWRLADEYDFEDRYRLSEKQIKQYNSILCDTNNYRKFIRMDSIKENFEAYPPFWYFFANTANCIVEASRKNIIDFDYNSDTEEYKKEKEIINEYSVYAREAYEKYYELCKKYNILREDQLTASFALEYSDLLYNENKRDKDKICELLKLAEQTAPNSLDILQLCAISYLKIGKTDDSIRVLRTLVNEEYNTITNAKLLSKLYVDKYINGNVGILSSYKILETQVDSLWLYPLPINNESYDKLEIKFLSRQKEILKTTIQHSLLSFQKKYLMEFDEIIPNPSNSKNDNEAPSSIKQVIERRIKAIDKYTKGKDHQDLKENYTDEVKECGFRIGYIALFNKMLNALEKFNLFRDNEKHNILIQLMINQIVASKAKLTEFQEKLDSNTFKKKDYCDLIENFNFNYFCDEFYKNLNSLLLRDVDRIENWHDMDIVEQDLKEFCLANNLAEPESYIYLYKEPAYIEKSKSNLFFSNNLLDSEHDYSIDDEQTKGEIYIKCKKCLEEFQSDELQVHLYDSSEFDSYFGNTELRNKNKDINYIKQKTVCVINDKTKRNLDLLLCIDGIRAVKKNLICGNVGYESVTYSDSGKSESLQIGYQTIYKNKNINLQTLEQLFKKM